MKLLILFVIIALAIISMIFFMFNSHKMSTMYAPGTKVILKASGKSGIVEKSNYEYVKVQYADDEGELHSIWVSPVLIELETPDDRQEASP